VQRELKEGSKVGRGQQRGMVESSKKNKEITDLINQATPGMRRIKYVKRDRFKRSDLEVKGVINATTT